MHWIPKRLTEDTTHVPYPFFTLRLYHSKLEYTDKLKAFGYIHDDVIK